MPFAADFDGWPVLIIPAIGFVVWLVSMVFRNATEPPKPNRRPPQQVRPAARDADEPRRQTSSDLDRFITETRRQRDADERRGGRTVPANQPQRRPVLLEEVEEVPLRPSAPRSVPQRPLARPAPFARQAAVPMLEIAEAISAAPVMQSLMQTALPVMPDAPTDAVDMLKRAETAVAPLLLDVRAMVASPESAQMAFAMREILDAPLCHRRGRR
jgi:hypothetical protein